MMMKKERKKKIQKMIQIKIDQKIEIRLSSVHSLIFTTNLKYVDLNLWL